MPADDYLELRSRLGLALFALGRLGDDLGVKPAPAEMINSLVAGLKDPFNVVVIGEVNAGKSMLLNALFGEEFCTTSELPSTEKIHFFRHGFTRQVLPHAEGYEEIRLPCGFLQDFHIVDTPGVNSIAEGHDVITEKFLPRADVVLFVLPISNPWGRKCWEFLKKIHHDLGKRIVLVLQQIDVRTEAEVTAIHDHLKLCCTKWLGRELPAFPVSAKNALLARTSGLDKDRLLSESRFPALERHLNEIVGGVSARRDKLRNTIRMGQFVITQIHGKLADKATKLSDVTDRLKNIQGDVAEQQKRSHESLRIVTKENVLESVGSEVVGPLPEAEVMLTQWKEAASATAESQRTEACKLLIADFSALWKKTRPSMEQALKSKVTAANEMQPDEASLRTLQQTAIDEIITLESLVNLTEGMHKTRHKPIWFGIAGSTLGLGLIVTGAALKNPWIISGGILLLILGVAGAFVYKRHHLQEGTRRLELLEREYAVKINERFEAALHQWIQKSFQHFGTAFRPLFELYERKRAEHESRLNEAEAGSRTLEELSREIGK